MISYFHVALFVVSLPFLQALYFSGRENDNLSGKSQIRLVFGNDLFKYQLFFYPNADTWSIYHYQYDETGFHWYTRSSANSSQWLVHAAVERETFAASGSGPAIAEFIHNRRKRNVDPASGSQYGTLTYNYTDLENQEYVHRIPYVVSMTGKLSSFAGYGNDVHVSRWDSEFQHFLMEDEQAAPLLEDAISPREARGQSQGQSQSHPHPRRVRTMADVRYSPSDATDAQCDTAGQLYAAVSSYVYIGRHPGFFSDGGGAKLASMTVCKPGSAYRATCTGYTLALDWWGYNDSAYTCTTNYNGAGGKPEFWVVFAGSQNTGDWLNDASLAPIDFLPVASSTASKIGVHRGFLSSFQSWKSSSLFSNIPVTMATYGTLRFLGHSLGGAVASVAAYYYVANNAAAKPGFAFASANIQITTLGEPAAFSSKPVEPFRSVGHTRYVNQANIEGCKLWYQPYSNQQDPVSCSTSALNFWFGGAITSIYNVWGKPACDSDDIWAERDFNQRSYWSHNTVVGSESCYASTCISVLAGVGFVSAGQHGTILYQGSQNSQSVC